METNMRSKTNQDGITLLVTLLLMGIFLGISASLLNITLKQFQLSGITAASEIAFQAANAGMECVLYYDKKTDGSEFSVPDDETEQAAADAPSIKCMDNPGNVSSDDSTNGSYTDPNEGNGRAVSGGEQKFQFDWGEPEVCSEVSIYKFSDADEDLDILVYGVDMRPDRNGSPAGSGDCEAGAVCTVVQARGYNVPCDEIDDGGRVVEREYTQVYESDS